MGSAGPSDLGRSDLIVASVRIGCADCGCVVESGRRVALCGRDDCCCAHLPIGGEAESSIDALAQRVKAALESAEPAQFAELLDPNVKWGAAEDPKPSCQNRDQVLRWYERGRGEGTRAHVISVEAHGDKILVQLRVFNLSDPTNEHERWQVMACNNGRVVDIRGFESRDEALVSVVV